MRPGQIAHLDQNRDNNALSNLAFLCLDHHDEYDSSTSQRKGFTLNEVKLLRDELHDTINKAFSQQVHFGEILTPPADPFAGSWIRLDCGINSAEIKLIPLPDSHEGATQYFISGFALWGADRERGPNLGTLEFVGEMTKNRTIVYSRGSFGNETVTQMTFFATGELVVVEQNWIGEYGMNVAFEGFYKRAEFAR